MPACFKRSWTTSPFNPAGRSVPCKYYQCPLLQIKEKCVLHTAHFWSSGDSLFKFISVGDRALRAEYNEFTYESVLTFQNVLFFFLKVIMEHCVLSLVVLDFFITFKFPTLTRDLSGWWMEIWSVSVKRKENRNCCSKSLCNPEGIWAFWRFNLDVIVWYLFLMWCPGFTPCLSFLIKKWMQHRDIAALSTLA